MFTLEQGKRNRLLEHISSLSSSVANVWELICLSCTTFNLYHKHLKVNIFCFIIIKHKNIGVSFK